MQAKFWPGGGPEPHFFLAFEKKRPYSEKNSSRKRFFGGRRERRLIGLQALGRHMLLELFDCDAQVINSLETVKGALVEEAKRAQATIVEAVFHEFTPFGSSGVVVIAESPLSIHTWPEYRYAAVDIFSCGDVLKPDVAAHYLVEQFGAARASRVAGQRGGFVQSAFPMTHKPVGFPG